MLKSAGDAEINIDRNMFICHIEHELFTHKRIVVVSPPLVEREIGFDLWLQKVVELSKELSVPILHLGHPDTQAVIAAKKNSGSLFSFKTFVDWHDPLSCGDHIREGDMIIFVSSPGISLFILIITIPTQRIFLTTAA